MKFSVSSTCSVNESIFSSPVASNIAVRSVFPNRLLTLIEKSSLGIMNPGLIYRSDSSSRIIDIGWIIVSEFNTPLTK